MHSTRNATTARKKVPLTAATSARNRLPGNSSAATPVKVTASAMARSCGAVVLRLAENIGQRRASPDVASRSSCAPRTARAATTSSAASA